MSLPVRDLLEPVHGIQAAADDWMKPHGQRLIGGLDVAQAARSGILAATPSRRLQGP